MPELTIKSTNPSRIVTDYDFTLTGGVGTSFTLDPKFGDTITFGDSEVVIELTAKPSIQDPDVLLGAESVTIYKTQILLVRKMERILTEATPDQQAEWKEFLISQGALPRVQ